MVETRTLPGPPDFHNHLQLGRRALTDRLPMQITKDGVQ